MDARKALAYVREATAGYRDESRDDLCRSLQGAFRAAQVARRNVVIIPEIDGRRLMQDGKFLRLDVNVCARQPGVMRGKPWVGIRWVEPAGLEI